MLRIVLDTAASHGASRIATVRVARGALSCVDPETLAFAFEVSCRGTPAEGCRLEFRGVPLRVSCRGCGLQENRQGPGEPCSACGAREADILEGRDLRIEAIDVDPDEEADT
jgi:hydrogenase nickel incorporation protein HypA/HybF